MDYSSITESVFNSLREASEKSSVEAGGAVIAFLAKDPQGEVGIVTASNAIEDQRVKDALVEAINKRNKNVL